MSLTDLPSIHDAFLAAARRWIEGTSTRLQEGLSIDFVIESSNRGGLGVEEAFQVTIPTTGTYRLRVTSLDCNPVVADVDGSCAVGFSDVLDVIGAWGPNPGHPADFDGDGVVGFSDLIELLGRWGSCPTVRSVAITFWVRWTGYCREFLTQPKSFRVPSAHSPAILRPRPPLPPLLPNEMRGGD